MLLVVCDNGEAHRHDDEPLMVERAAGEPWACEKEGCGGQLWLNRGCLFMLPGSQVNPPEECADPVEPGSELCSRHFRATHDREDYLDF